MKNIKYLLIAFLSTSIALFLAVFISYLFETNPSNESIQKMNFLFTFLIIFGLINND